MAHPEHIELVQQGVEAIAAWHAVHAGERLDLEAATLTGAYLPGAQLQGANLERAALHAADLRRVHLHGAYLAEACLQGAHLEGAVLQWTNLEKANLQDAHLEQAHLEGANLQTAHLGRANLQAANLYECVFGHTTFASTNLHAALGLDTCRHEGSSNLDIETLVQSGTLPALFLRGCGWPEELIINVMALLQNVQEGRASATLVAHLRAWQPLLEQEIPGKNQG